MRRLSKTKITIGVIVFIVICLIVGLTLYFVLRKKHTPSSATVSPSHVKGVFVRGVPSSNNYLEAKTRAQNLYQEVSQHNSGVQSTMKLTDDEYYDIDKSQITRRRNIIIDYLSFYNSTLDTLKLNINKILDIYNFVGDYNNPNDKAGEFVYNRDLFKNTTVPGIKRSIDTFSPKFNKSDLININTVAFDEYYRKVGAAVGSLEFSEEGLMSQLDLIIHELSLPL